MIVSAMRGAGSEQEIGLVSVVVAVVVATAVVAAVVVAAVVAVVEAEAVVAMAEVVADVGSAVVKILGWISVFPVIKYGDSWLNILDEEIVGL